jgi:Uncharacterised nucleotidyltransferase
VRESFWPTPIQERLFQVALGDDAEAVAAWRALRPRIDLERLEPGSFGLLPLVYRALERVATDDPLLPRLKGIYRSTWVKNSLLVERVGETFDTLSARGIDAVLLGGLGSGVRFYGDYALRPTSIIEVLVAPAARASAVAALGRVGWIAQPQGTPLWLTDAQGRSCVLKTRLASDFGPDATLLDVRQTIDLRGHSVSVLTPGDELLAACVTGARKPSYPTVQWILDAALAIGASSASLDWDRFVELAAAHDQLLRARRALAYVASLPRVHLPAQVLPQLEAGAVALRVRFAYAMAAKAPAGGRLAAKLVHARDGS